MRRSTIKGWYGLAALGMMVVLGACQPKGESGGALELRFDTLAVTDRALLEPAGTDSIPYHWFELSLVYPVSGLDSGKLTALQKWVFSTYCEAEVTTAEAATRYVIDERTKVYRDENKQDYLERLADATAEDESPADDYMFEYSQSNAFPYVCARYVSMCNYFRSYSGGAHGSFHTEAHVLNLQTLKPVHEQDFFRLGYGRPLQQLIQKHLIEYVERARSEDQEQDEDLGDPQDVFFDFATIRPNDNFYLCDTGIYYYYAPYEIAAYAEGEFEVFIPLEELVPLVDRECFMELYGREELLQPAPEPPLLPSLAENEGVEYEDAERRVVVTSVRADGLVEVKVQPKVAGGPELSVAAPGFRGVVGDLLVLGTTAEGESSEQTVYNLKYGFEYENLIYSDRTRNFAVDEDGQGYSYSQELQDTLVLRWSAAQGAWEAMGTIPEEARNADMERLQQTLQGSVYDGMEIIPLRRVHVDANSVPDFEERGYVWDLKQ